MSSLIKWPAHLPDGTILIKERKPHQRKAYWCIHHPHLPFSLDLDYYNELVRPEDQIQIQIPEWLEDEPIEKGEDDE